MTPTFKKALLFVSLSCLAMSASAHGPLARGEKATVRQDSAGKALMDHIDHVVHFTDDQRRQAQGFLEQYESAVQAVSQNGSLSDSEKSSKRDELKGQLRSQVEGLLTPDQADKLQKSREFLPWLPVRPALGVSYGLYFPSDAVTRSIFGNSVSSFGVSVSDAAKIGPGTRLGFSLSDVSLNSNGNKLFVIAPQLSVTHWIRLAQDVAVYGKVGAGPAYFDYSYNDPSGTHFGAKRLGAELSPELGFRLYDRLQIAVAYHLLSQPSGIPLSGLELEAKLILFKF